MNDMKTISFFLALATCTAASAQTIPLSQSATFNTKADLSGAVFTGPLRGAAGVSRDAQYYMDLAGGNPRLNFDMDDHLDFDRTNNTFSFAIANGAVLMLGRSPAGRSYISFDGFGSRIEFGNGGVYQFFIGGNMIAALDGNGTLKTKGPVIANQGGSCC